MSVMLLLLLQAASPPVGSPQRFSILVDPCATAGVDRGKDIVVCGNPDTVSPRLPLRDDRGPPDHPTPANPYADGAGALAMEAAPCGARMGGCPGVFGEPIVAAALRAVGDGIKDLEDARRRHRNGGQRVAIDLDAPSPPIPSGAIRP